MSRASCSVSEVGGVLSQARRVLVVSHFNPDPDAIGSTCGLTLALLDAGKEVVSINESNVLPVFSYIPNAESIESQIPEDQGDVLVILDCGDLARLGDTFRVQLESHPCIVNIDHHISNTFFGKYDLVDDGASSTAELVYRLLEEMKLAVTGPVARCLMTGMMADTGSFRYSQTSSDTFRVAADLVDKGAIPHEISKPLYESRSKASVLLRSHLLSNITFHFGDRVGEVLALPEVVSRFGASGSDTEGLVEEARAIDGVVISIFIRNSDGIWRVSLRSKDPAIDVSKVAEQFGGGGHRGAAAFRSRQSLEELREKLLNSVEIALKG